MDQVFEYNPNADLKQDSVLENLKKDKSIFPHGLSYVTEKINNKDLHDISQKEQESWIEAFKIALTDEFTLTKEQLLTSHNWWTSRLSYELGDDLHLLVDDLTKTNHKNIHEFVDDLTNRLNLEQMNAINVPGLD